MMGFRSSFAMALSIFLITASGSVTAQENNEIFLDATYLGSPTDWCPTNAGVPVVFKMDGPDIIPSPEDWPRTVRVRRGGKVSTIGSEKSTHSLQQRRVFNIEIIGRFSAEFRACQDPWSIGRVEGRWHLKASDGSELGAGALGPSNIGLSSLVFFHSANRSSDARYIEIGDRTFFTASRPNVTTSQTFAAEKDKE